MARRDVPLIVLASPAGYLTDQVATRLRRDGAVVYATHSQGGCLRVATNVAPDMVVLHPSMSTRLERLLHAHPATAHAQIVHLSPALMTDLTPVTRPNVAVRSAA